MRPERNIRGMRPRQKVNGPLFRSVTGGGGVFPCRQDERNSALHRISRYDQPPPSLVHFLIIAGRISHDREGSYPARNQERLLVSQVIGPIRRCHPILLTSNQTCAQGAACASPMEKLLSRSVNEWDEWDAPVIASGSWQSLPCCAGARLPASSPHGPAVPVPSGGVPSMLAGTWKHFRHLCTS